MRKDILRLEDLNNYALLEIFDAMELDELLNLVDTSNSRLRELITRHQIVNRFRIHEKILKARNDSPQSKIECNNNSVIVDDHVVLLKLLRNFGHIITRISIIHRHNKSTNSVRWYQRAIEYINEYCSDSLVELMLSGEDESTVDLILIPENYSTYIWQKPFKKLNKLVIKDAMMTDVGYNVSEIFPSLQYLGITLFGPHHFEIFNQHFPQLVHVTFPFRTFQEYHYKFLEINPQIRSIRPVIVHDLDALRNISGIMQNLETIDILFIEMENNETVPIEFKSVKKVYMRFWFNYYFTAELSNAIKFEEAEELNIFGWNWSTHRNWMNFVLKHPNLKALNKWDAILNLQEYLSIIAHSPELAEIISFLDTSNTNDALLSLMQTKTNLKKITFYSSTLDDGIFLRNVRYPEWEIEIESDLLNAEADEFIRDTITIEGGPQLSPRYYASERITFIRI